LFSGQTWDSTAQQVDEPTTLTTFANFMLLPQGETAEFNLLYTLPAGVVQPQPDGTILYELRVNKQAGTRPEPLAILVTLPQGVELVETSPSGASIAGNVVTFESTLESNTILRLRFR
jgi:hypothetical protein